MAFTDAEKAQIRRYLGAPLMYQDQFSDITSRIGQLEVVPANETATKALLVKIAAVETQLETAPRRLKMTSVGGGDVVFAGPQEIAGLNDHGLRLCAQLASMMDLIGLGYPLAGNPFSMGGGSSDMQIA